MKAYQTTMVVCVLFSMLACSDNSSDQSNKDGSITLDDGVLDFIDDASLQPSGSNASTDGTVADSNSGSRLKAVMLTAPGVRVSLPQNHFWYDSKLGVECSFFEMTDGTTRCLPGQFTTNQLYYLDEKCEGKPVVFVSPQTTAKLGWDDDDCVPAEKRYVRIQSNEYTTMPGLLNSRKMQAVALAKRAQSYATEVFKKNEAGECGKSEPPAENNGAGSVINEQYSVTIVENTDQYAQANIETTARQDNARLGRVEIVAEDNARQFLSFFDHGREEYCSIKSTADGNLRCLPKVNVRDVVTDLFANEDCTGPVASYVRGNSYDEPLYASQRTAATCDGEPQPKTTTLFRIGEIAETKSRVHLLNGYDENGQRNWECEQYAEDRTGHLAHPVGDEIPADEFASVTYERADGDSRLLPSYASIAADTDTSPLRIRQLDTFWDTDLKVECSFGPASDGKWRCLPKSSGFVVYSAGCETVVGVAAPCIENNGYVRIASSAGSNTLCDPLLYDVYTHGDMYNDGTITGFHRKIGADGECAFITINNFSPDGMLLYRLGNRVKPDQFVAATKTPAED